MTFHDFEGCRDADISRPAIFDQPADPIARNFQVAAHIHVLPYRLAFSFYFEVGQQVHIIRGCHRGEEGWVRQVCRDHFLVKLHEPALWDIAVQAKDMIDSKARHDHIAAAAFERSQHRDRFPGDALSDWLAAEAQFDYATSRW